MPRRSLGRSYNGEYRAPSVTVFKKKTHLKFFYAELCQACLTQEQVAQHRFLVTSGVLTLESGRWTTKSNALEWDSGLGYFTTVVRFATTALCLRSDQLDHTGISCHWRLLHVEWLWPSCGP